MVQLKPSLLHVLLGQQINYICPVSLQDCLERLQSKSEREKEAFLFSQGLLVTILFRSRNEYNFRIELASEGSLYTPVSIRGKLQRLDAVSTNVEIDTQRPMLHNVAIIIILGMPISWVVITGIIYFGFFFIIFAIILLLSLVKDDRRRVQLAELVLQTLPPS